MSPDRRGQITELLGVVANGDSAARDRLWSLIYDELHTLAQQQMANESPGRTLQPTALVHEAYLRLLGGDGYAWANRKQFFAAAAEAMRRIRVDDARRRGRLKRGGGERESGRGGDRDRGAVDEPAVFDGDPSEDLAIDEALTGLEAVAPRQAQIVKLRYFTGLTVPETAEVLGLSARTVEYDWEFVRAWLHRALSGARPGGTP